MYALQVVSEGVPGGSDCFLTQQIPLWCTYPAEKWLRHAIVLPLGSFATIWNLGYFSRLDVNGA